jgi:arylsulfatase
VERIDPATAGDPHPRRGELANYFPGMGRLSENSVINIKNKSFSVTAELEIPGRRGRGDYGPR